MATWYTLEEIRAVWLDAPSNDELLAELLDVAKVQVIAYAPVIYTPQGNVSQTPTTSMRWAQKEQSRNIWNASKVSPSGDMGMDTFVITPKPLDWHVQQVLRPATGLPRISSGTKTWTY